MHKLMRAFLAVVIPAAMLTAATTAEAAPAPVTIAAETACDSYTNVSVGDGWYLHVPSLSADPWNFNCVVVRGHHNIAVLVLQESLYACYGQGIARDWDFGANTERAVRNAQTRINQLYGNVLTVDGRFGPKTSSYFNFQAYDHNNGGAHTGYCYRW